MNASKQNTPYPAQTAAYKVFVKDKGEWQKHDTARLQISVGNPKHEGEKFFALTEWASHRFDKVILIVSDTLQRHNLAFQQGFSMDDAYRLSSMMGKEWLKKNRNSILNLSAEQRKVTLWDDWLNHPDYAATYDEITTLFEVQSDFRRAVNQKAIEFCQRGIRQNALSVIQLDQKALETSTSYILEEVAAFAIMFRETAAIDVYPGEWFKDVFSALANTRRTALLSGFETAECMRVDFARNKACQPALHANFIQSP